MSGYFVHLVIQNSAASMLAEININIQFFPSRLVFRDNASGSRRNIFSLVIHQVVQELDT